MNKIIEWPLQTTMDGATHLQAVILIIASIFVLFYAYRTIKEAIVYLLEEDDDK